MSAPALPALGNGLGFALVCAGSYGAGGETQPADGLQWLAVSVCGLMVAGVTNALWFMDARRRLSRERIFLLGPGKPRPRYARTTLEVIPAPAPLETPVSRARSSLFHRPGCELVVGRTTSAAPYAVHESDGRRPCEVCEP